MGCRCREHSVAIERYIQLVAGRIETHVERGNSGQIKADISPSTRRTGRQRIRFGVEHASGGGGVQGSTCAIGSDSVNGAIRQIGGPVIPEDAAIESPQYVRRLPVIRA